MDPRYPIGKFDFSQTVTNQMRPELIDQVRRAPKLIRHAVEGLDDRQLDTPYRPDGWTVRQVVHHLADSHINSYVRFRLTLTEDEPQVKSYNEKKWAELADARTGPVEWSLALLTDVHRRWVALLESLDDAQWARCFQHTDLGLVPLQKVLALYAWHGRHHVAHITGLRERMGW